MNDLIGRIPIVGGLLTKMIPIDDWEDSIKNNLPVRVSGDQGLKVLVLATKIKEIIGQK